MMAADPVEQIKDRISILDVVSPVVSLKKAGRNYKGLCPFHSEKTPSFIVFPDKGNYHCFGCGANGDIFSFVMQTRNVDFGEAIKELAQRAGVDLPEWGGGGEKDSVRARLMEVNGAAAQFFNNLLLKSEAAATARAVLAERGISEETVSRFQLGYSPDSWDASSTYLRKLGFETADLDAAGLLVKREDGGYYDRFRGRLMYPIRDQRGRVLGFGARTLDNSQPKYLNSPETPVFDKGGNLYGIDLAASSIRQADRVVIVEGYMDVLMGHQSGITYMVASLGTSLTDRQVGLLKKLTRNLVLALDPDQAGDEATSRGLDVARQVFGGITVPVPTGRGLILESKLDADIRVMSLPRGKDPDELIREDVGEWHRRLANAKPVIDYYFDVLLADLDLTSARGKSAAVERLGPVVREIPDLMQRWHYIQQLAQRIGVGEQVVATAIGRSSKRVVKDRRGPKVESIERSEPRKGLSLEEYCLMLLLRNPELTRHPVRIEVEDIRDSQGRELLRMLYSRLAAGLAVSADTLSGEVSGALGAYLDDLVGRAKGIPELPADELEREASRCFAELRRANIRERIREISELKQDAESSGDKEAVRELVAITEDLLAQLEPYERASSRAWVSRQKPATID